MVCPSVTIACIFNASLRNSSHNNKATIIKQYNVVMQQNGIKSAFITPVVVITRPTRLLTTF